MPSINGNDYQHSNVGLSAQGIGVFYAFTKFEKLSYEDGAEKKPTVDWQGQVDGYTIDGQKLSGQISMRLTEWFKFKQALVSSRGFTLGVGQIPFDMTVSYGPTLSTLRADFLTGVMVQKEPKSSEKNQEALVVEIPLFLMGIKADDQSRFIQYPLLIQP